MANIKSQIKRNRQNEKRRLRNRTARGGARAAVNLARTAFDENAPETKDAVLKAISALDKAAGKGVIHKNNAARRKGRLMKRLASFTPSEATAEAAPKAKKASKPKAKTTTKPKAKTTSKPKAKTTSKKSA